MQSTKDERAKKAINFLRQNPHRLQLGNLGFEILKKDGSKAQIEDIKDIRQTLNPWTGEIKSQFSVEGEKVEVQTYSHQQKDLISVKI